VDGELGGWLASAVEGIGRTGRAGHERAPLLILQGENDIRVRKEEAEQVYDILKKEGRTFDAHFYPAEGHGFAKPENQIDSIRRTVDWFDKYLKGAGSSSAASN
jgi:dipeptidyl aminopeptidase/acylaminoacyl peptidase